MVSNARALLTFHHILSSRKKEVIRTAAKDMNIYGVCKFGYPGVLAFEGTEGNVKSYVRQIKLLRWQTCTLSNITLGLSPEDLRICGRFSAPGIEMMDKMSDVGLFMRKIGLDEWWRDAMGYSKAQHRTTLAT